MAEKGYKPERKIQKTDPGPTLCKKRLKFSKDNEHITPQQWEDQLQAVGDIKEFTWYPKKLQPKFKRVRAPWTYMTKQEKKKPAFVRPKRWFPKKEYKLVKKQKAFGFTTSNGQSIAFLLPNPWNHQQWAKLINSKLAPLLKKAFPARRDFQILLDGEGVLHAPAAKAAFAKHKIKIFPGWPHHSPDLNPQENVWKVAEQKLRELEQDNDTFQRWQKAHCSSHQGLPFPTQARLWHDEANG